MFGGNLTAAPSLPLTLWLRGYALGQSMATSGISHNAGTGVVSFTMTGNALAIGDRLRVSFTGGSASPAGVYAVTNVAGAVVTLQVNVGGSAITGVTPSWAIKATSSFASVITSSTASACTFSFSNADALVIGAGVAVITGNLSAATSTSATWEGIDGTSGVKTWLLVAKPY